MNQDEMIARMSTLFKGSELCYGQYDQEIAETADGSGKARGKFRSVFGPTTEKQWEDHFGGIHQLAISPLKKDGMCSFGAIDLDEGHHSIHDLMVRAQGSSLLLPIVGVRSKSKNIHLFTFFVSCPFIIAHARMRCFVTDLRLSAEVYPRPSRGMGNLGPTILVPYFGGKGQPSMVEQFIREAEDTRKYWSGVRNVV